MESQERRREREEPEEFVTVVNVAAATESFVTVLSIGTGKRCIEENGIDPAHPEEEVEVYRLPGERLGFGLKFDGGNKTSEKVRRLFIQSCAEQSPASRAKCSWGSLGEGDEVLSIDGVPVPQMTRLDCVRRLKESQLVIKLRVRCRGALKPEVVSAERKLSNHQQHQEHQLNKVPPELPAAPPPVPPRKLRHSSQAANNRGSADGEASPGLKKAWDNTKSAGSSQSGSPQSQGSFRSATSSIRSSNYETCTSSPAKSYPGSKNDSPKDSPKVHVSPVLIKAKQEQPPEAQSYLDARSQDGSSTHDSTSDDTSSTLSTVIDRFSISGFSTASTASTTSEQIIHPDAVPKGLDSSSDLFLANGIIGLSNPDFLLTRLANSEARTFVESRGDVELITAVVAPNTVVIEETPTLQPPLSFQDAPLSYGHEPRPGIFYSADLAADSKTHFRPIKDDAELVDKVFNGELGEKEAPPLPIRNHVNRIPINQQESQPTETNSSSMPVLPPKPMPRKDLKAKRKRPPPPPPPPRREPPPPVPEVRCLNNTMKNAKEELEETKTLIQNNNVIEKKENDTVKNKESLCSEVIDVKSKEFIINDENANEQIENLEMDSKTNKVLEIVEMKKAKTILPQKESSRISDEYEVPRPGMNVFIMDDDEDEDDDSENDHLIGVEFKNSINRKILDDMDTISNLSIEIDRYLDDEEEVNANEENEKNEASKNQRIKENDDVSSKEMHMDTISENYEIRKMKRYEGNDFDQLDSDSEEDLPLVKIINNDATDGIDADDDDLTDESDGDYYWQSNLATIGEEEENNSLEYENA